MSTRRIRLCQESRRAAALLLPVFSWLLAAAGLGQTAGLPARALSPVIIRPAAPTTNGLASDPLMSLMLSQPRLEVSEPVVPTASFDPPVVRPGEPATYRVVLNALEDSIAWPEKIPVPEELVMRAAGRGQILQLGGAVMRPRTTFNYRVQVGELGRFTIPRFEVRVNGKPVVVPEASLEAHPSPPGSIGRTQLLGFEPETTRPFVGQYVPVRVLLAGTPGGIVQAMSQVEVVGQGIITDQSVARQRVETVVQNGRPLATYIYETMITAITAGEVSAFAQGYAIGNRFTGATVLAGPAGLSGAGFQYTLLDSDPVTLRVRPLPPEGRLPGFTGAIGVFQLDRPRVETTEAKVGDPLRLSVTLRGTGNLPRVVAPPPPRSREWQVFAAPRDDLPMQVLQAQGSTHLYYTLVPMAVTRATPAIPFSYFDPSRERYVDLTIPSVPVRVQPGRVPADPAAIARAAQLDQNREPESLRLAGIVRESGLGVASLVPVQQRAWFPVLQAAPLPLFLGLWAWDRRRRFLEAHPEIVRCRRARRALRRHKRGLRRAADKRDAGAFATAAVGALRVACAPHFPAEPRALVCSDVLSVLSPEERVGRGEVVSRLFSAADRARFAPEAAASPELLELAPGLDEVLDLLGSKLSPGTRSGADGGVRAGEAPRDLSGNAISRALSGSVSLFVLFALTLLAPVLAAADGTAPLLFERGTEAYRRGDYAQAAVLFRQAACERPSAGALANLGTAEWLNNRKGPAVLAWEQALWLEPLNHNARQNLRYARATAHLESPELAWFEVVSTWLPVNAWAWLAGASLWITVGLAFLPGSLRVSKRSWHQAVAAASLAVFLLSLPAHLGVNTRSRMGFILQPDTPLRLTPTRQAQFVTRLAAGEPARCLRQKGDFILVKAARTQGWVHRHQFGRLVNLQ